MEDLITHLRIVSKLPVGKLRVYTRARIKPVQGVCQALNFNTTRPLFSFKFHIVSHLYKTITCQAVV